MLYRQVVSATPKFVLSSSLLIPFLWYSHHWTPVGLGTTVHNSTTIHNNKFTLYDFFRSLVAFLLEYLVVSLQNLLAHLVTSFLVDFAKSIHSLFYVSPQGCKCPLHNLEVTVITLSSYPL